MRFTWLTYRLAHRRAFRREYQAFCDHAGAFRGPHVWYAAMRFSERLHERERRERGVQWR